jgi:hypothetical protein
LDNTLVAAYIAAGSTVVGVIIGGIITSITGWHGSLKRRKNVRRVLSWEHAYNIGILEEFWKQVNRESQPQGQFDCMEEFGRNLHLSEGNLDDWGHQMWQSYAGEVASVLSEDEFNQSYRLHNTLDKFSSRRKSLVAIIYGDFGKAGMMAYNKQKQLQSSSSGAYTPIDIATVTNANEFVRPLWDECVGLYTICHQIGNPIRS